MSSNRKVQGTSFPGTDNPKVDTHRSSDDAASRARSQVPSQQFAKVCQLIGAVRGSRGQDHTAYNELIVLLDPWIGSEVRRCHRYGLNEADREDLKQEVDIAILTRLDTLIEPSRVYSWLKPIIQHHAVDMARRLRRRPVELICKEAIDGDRDEQDPIGCELDPAEEVLAHDGVKSVIELLRSLVSADPHVRLTLECERAQLPAKDRRGMGLTKYWEDWAFHAMCHALKSWIDSRDHLVALLGELSRDQWDEMLPRD